MSSNDIPNQYNLLGENTPMWLVLSLLLAGTIGSITTTWLALPPGLTFESLISWAIQSKNNEHTSKPPTPVIRASEIPSDTTTVTTHTNSKAEPASQTVEDSASRQMNGSNEIQETKSAILPNTTDEPVTTESAVAIVIHEDVAVDESPRTEVNDTNRELNSMPTASIDTGDGIAVNLNESKTIETITPPRIQSITDTDKKFDCAPLFFVQFKRGGIQPIDLDLNDKVTRLREWLSLHPETKVIVEGHADASGPEELNLLISHRRAKAVAEIFARAGIADDQMVTRAFGEYSPLSGLPPESKRNRRVSLRIEGARACSEATSDGEK